MNGNEDLYENQEVVILHPIPKDQMWIHNEFNKINLSINNLRKELFKQDKESKKNQPVLHKVVNCHTLNVRLKPNKESKSVDILHVYDLVYVYDKKDGWYQIDKKGTRYCYGEYLEPVVIK